MSNLKNLCGLLVAATVMMVVVKVTDADTHENFYVDYPSCTGSICSHASITININGVSYCCLGGSMYRRMINATAFSITCSDPQTCGSVKNEAEVVQVVQDVETLTPACTGNVCAKSQQTTAINGVTYCCFAGSMDAAIVNGNVTVTCTGDQSGFCL